jgi:hypothetical protein
MLSHLSNFNSINIPVFVPANQVRDALRTGRLRFPIVGRSLQHQAGSGYWLCLSNRVVEWALRSGASYFQQWEDIDKEYRVHVFRNQALGCYKKVLRENPVDDLGRTIAREIIDDVPNLNEEQIMKVVKKTARHMTNPDFNIRSLHRGWRFSAVDPPPTAVVNMAIAAVRESGLDFGAVDMMRLDDSTVKFIELNTGPGMDVGSRIFNNYVSSFQRVINNPTPQIITRQRQRRRRVDPPHQAVRIPNANNRRGLRRRRNANR